MKNTGLKKYSFVFTIIILFCIFHVSFNSYASKVPQRVIDSSESVVRIYASNQYDLWSGSGFVIANDNTGTYIVTNNHVAVEDNPDSIMIILNSNTQINAEVIVADESVDIAVLKISYPLKLKPLRLNIDSWSKGDEVYAIGYPDASDILSDNVALNTEDSTITDGIISTIRTAKITENGQDVELIQVSAAINPGNSGGPVLDEKGNVIGISTYSVSDSQAVNGAVSVSALKKVLDEHGIAYRCKLNFLIIQYIACLVGALILIIIILKKVINKNSYRSINSKISKKAIVAFGILIIFWGTTYSINAEYEHLFDRIEKTNLSIIDKCFIKITSVFDNDIQDYVDACILLNSKKYDEAGEIFSDLKGYRNSDKMYLETEYQKGIYELNLRNFSNAINIFLGLHNYKNSQELIYETRYQEAWKYYDDGNLQWACYLMKGLVKDGYEKANDDYETMLEEIKSNNHTGINEKYRREDYDSYTDYMNAKYGINGY